MAPPDRFEALCEDHVERGPQAEHQMLGRRAAMLHVEQRVQARGPVPIGRAHRRLPVRMQRLAVRGDESEARRRHQPLLRRRHRDVDTECIHVERHAAERRDAVDHVQRRMAGGIDGAADRPDIVDHAGSGVDLDRQHSLDRVLLVLAQALLDRSGIDRRAPGAGEHLDISAHEPGHLAPADGETATGEHEHLVAAREHIGERRLPTAMAIGSVEEGLPRRAEDRLEIGQQAFGEVDDGLRGEFLGRAHHRLENAIGNIGRARHCEQDPAIGDTHDIPPPYTPGQTR